MITGLPSLEQLNSHDQADGPGPGRGAAVSLARGAGAASGAGVLPKSRIDFWVSAARTVTTNTIPATGKKISGPR